MRSCPRVLHVKQVSGVRLVVPTVRATSELLQIVHRSGKYSTQYLALCEHSVGGIRKDTEAREKSMSTGRTMLKNRFEKAGVQCRARPPLLLRGNAMDLEQDLATDEE